MITMQQSVISHQSLRCFRVNFRATTQQLLILLLLIPLTNMKPAPNPACSQQSDTLLNKHNHSLLHRSVESPVPTLLLPGGICNLSTDLLPGGICNLSTDSLPGGMSNMSTGSLPGGMYNLSTGSIPCYQEPPIPTSAVIVHIVGLRSRGGQVCIAVFDSDENFRNEKPLKDKKLMISSHNRDTLTVSVQLPAGLYGISVLDDSNSDGGMNYGFAGIPLEGFGFSGYRQKGLKRPRFSDFSFTHSANTQVEIRMTYLR